MERVIATHHHDGHQLDVIELVDDEDITIRLAVDGQLLPADVHHGHVPTAEEARALLATNSERDESARATDHSAPHRETSPQEVIALLDALDDLQRAHATYAQVISDLGETMPFSNITESKKRHIARLGEVMHRHAVPVPANPWPAQVTRYGSVADACADAVEIERTTAALCSRLLATVERPDVRDAIHEIEEASRHRHLPAFQRCVQREEP